MDDVESIGHAVDELLPFEAGWRTELQMALTTGWLSYPTPEDSVLFRNQDGKAVLVVWFGTGWMGAAAYDGSSQGKYFRRASAEEVEPLRNALRIDQRSTEPAQKAAQAGSPA